MSERTAHISLRQFVRRRNGVPLGAPGSLGNMLSRAFFATSFAGFWRHWNPIWGYGLSRYVNAPLNRLLGSSIALLGTFVVSGLIHDAVIMALRGQLTLLFTPWFALMAAILLAGESWHWRFDGLPRWQRGVIMFLYAALTFAATLLFSRRTGLW